MKTLKLLVVLMFVCQLMNGQMSKEFEAFLDTVKWELSDFSHLGWYTDKEYIELKAIKVLISEWDIYKKEYYADSTLEHTHDIKWNDNCLRRTGNLAIGYHLVLDCQDSSHYSYTHKDPNNLSEFMEYLKQKYLR